MNYVLLLLSTLACTVSARPLCQHVSPVARATCDKRWTVLVYMNGDNDLSPYTFIDLAEMRKVGSSATLDIVVQQDTDDHNGSRRYHVHRSDNLKDSLITTLPEQDSGNPQTLIDFLAFGVSNYPSQHYMVIIWSHGTGYAGGIAPDYSASSQMSIAQLSSALAYLQYAHLHGRKIDIYASDACLMQSLEVIYALRQRARFIIGSANREQKNGWPYQAILRYLGAPTPPKQLGAGLDHAYWSALEIPHLYLQHYFERDDWATMNTVVASEIARRDYQSLQSTLQRLSQTLLAFVRRDPLLHPLLVITAVTNAYQYAPANRELKTFLAQLQTLTARGSAVHRASSAVQDALAQMLLKPEASDPDKQKRYFHARAFGHGTMAAGLSLWLPASRAEFIATHKTFATMPLLQDTGWYQLQAELFSD